MAAASGGAGDSKGAEGAEGKGAELAPLLGPGHEDSSPGVPAAEEEAQQRRFEFMSKVGGSAQGSKVLAQRPDQRPDQLRGGLT